MKKVVIAGGSGYLGKLLHHHFSRKNWDVQILTRQNEKELSSNYNHWDGEHIGPWIHCLEGAEMLINLSGKSVDCRYHRRNKVAIIDSRVNSTKTLGEALVHLNCPPKLWINASSATIYEEAFEGVQDEYTGTVGDNFSERVCKMWEESFFSLHTPMTRKVAIRTSFVLGKGPLLNEFLNLVSWGIGSRLGSGKQKMSWISEEDFLRSIEFIRKDETLDGQVNITHPRPVRNREFMTLLKQIKGKRFLIPVDTCLIKLGAFIKGTEAELVLKSRNVIPRKLLDHGFQFQHADLHMALQQILHPSKS